jgi:hypothetical protein
MGLKEGLVGAGGALGTGVTGTCVIQLQHGLGDQSSMDLKKAASGSIVKCTWKWSSWHLCGNRPQHGFENEKGEERMELDVHDFG